MSKLNILFDMGFYKEKNVTHIYIDKSNDIQLTMSIKDIQEMEDSEFRKFHNNVIDWLCK